MVQGIVALAMVATIATTPTEIPVDKCENIGEYRITTYCQHCNEPSGRQTASGNTLEYGQVAMNDVPFGTQIAIDGEVFEVTDRVGVENTVDIYMPTEKEYCTCNYLDYKEVMMKIE